MTREGAIIILTNTASFLRDGTRYFKPEHEKQFREAYEMAIKALEQAEPQWIPVTERLPEKYGEYLVTMTEKAKAEDLGFDIDEIYIRKMRYNSNGWQLPRHIPSWINDAVKDEVLAWMPLPEPYKEDPCNGCDYLGESCVGEGCGKLTERKDGETE